MVISFGVLLYYGGEINRKAPLPEKVVFTGRIVDGCDAKARIG